VSVELPKPGLVERVQNYERLILNVAALALAFVIAFMALRSMKRVASGAPQSAPALAGAASGSRGVESATRPMMAAPDSRARVIASVEQHPDAAAKLARAWLKES
jgi:hypothetical protein